MPSVMSGTETDREQGMLLLLQLLLPLPPPPPPWLQPPPPPPPWLQPPPPAAAPPPPPLQRLPPPAATAQPLSLPQAREPGVHHSTCFTVKLSDLDVAEFLKNVSICHIVSLQMLLCVFLLRPLGSALAAFVSRQRSLSAVDMQAKIKRMLVPKPARPASSFHPFSPALPSKPPEEPSDEELVRAVVDIMYRPLSRSRSIHLLPPPQQDQGWGHVCLW
ncbi:uncharacterized protein LOC117249182 isoform X1 [Epinephelus lanceolatus]|uniref:uncharacterized proline-rich protein-like isoform X2 n=1 Tax=Epinephelus lanceolatus TaxID=310571 RepID=UPI001444B6E6|nr:uncharacterized proline-rich protein-like isoform X2 [Epinephelus lanceolatus]